MFLGLDLGTTNVKVVVVDHDGSLVSQGTAPVDRTTTPDGGVEQDIDQIWDAACQAIREAVANVDAAKIQAVGISSQGGAMQLLDGDEKPIGRVISWLDERGRPFDRQIEAQWGESYLVEHTGSNLSTTSLGQLLRLQEQSPKVLEASAGIGYVGDLIVKKLCGRRGHDGTNLSLAMLYNPSLGQADPDLLRRLKIDGKRLPDLLRATETAGPLQADAAAATGLPEGIPVSPAIHDQYAARDRRWSSCRRRRPGRDGDRLGVAGHDRPVGIADRAANVRLFSSGGRAVRPVASDGQCRRGYRLGLGANWSRRVWRRGVGRSD